MMNKKRLLFFGMILLVTFTIIVYLKNTPPRTVHITGQTMGGIIYNIKYIHPIITDLDTEIANELMKLNASLSTYVPDSEVSRLNNEGQLTYESRHFLPILMKSKEVHERTYGAFDPSVAPLIQAWGFGPSKTTSDPDSTAIDSLKSLVDFDKVDFDETSVSIPEHFQLDFSAIAKGYAVDLTAARLEAKGIENYLVEIGGEVTCSGKNEEGKLWALGIEYPTVSKNDRQLIAVIRLKNRSLATSGNYRNYYEKEGRIHAHIIDPRTGYNADNNLLSVSVVAANCMTADAYATAFMVMGLQQAKAILSAQNLEALIIYSTADGTIEHFATEAIRPFLESR